MAHLDLKASSALTEMTPDARWGTRLTVTLASSDLKALGAALQSALIDAPSELRLELPGGWTLFWKNRDGDSRMLLAHPETDAWVGTIWIRKECCAAVIGRLLMLTRNQGPLPLSSLLGDVGGMSNLDVAIALR